VMHSLFYADEVRSIDDIALDGGAPVRAAEVDLARRLIEQLSSEEFRPQQYRDAYRERVQTVVDKKVAGEEVATTEATAPRAQVIDLMQALKESLARRGGRNQPAAEAPPAKGGGTRHKAAAEAGSRRGEAASARRARKK